MGERVSPLDYVRDCEKFSQIMCVNYKKFPRISVRIAFLILTAIQSIPALHLL